MVGWLGQVAPTGTPAGAIQRANADINTLLAERDLAERIAASGPLAQAGGLPDKAGALLSAEHRR